MTFHVSRRAMTAFGENVCPASGRFYRITAAADADVRRRQLAQPAMNVR
jgi:hypothetical protein